MLAKEWHALRMGRCRDEGHPRRMGQKGLCCLGVVSAFLSIDTDGASELSTPGR
jgi:hypothetical protein